ncbi:MAG: STAS domain-containing protein [Armatimonadota bacterium]|nr:STAS domain-containing protein [Armatimonadota bacterium]
MSETRFHFRCRFGDANGIPTLVVAGELDAVTVPQFRQAVRFHLGADPEAPLILDLSGLSFLDTEGLRALLATRNELLDRLALTGVGSPVRRVFEVTGVARLFTMAETPADAVRLLTNRGPGLLPPPSA